MLIIYLALFYRKYLNMIINIDVVVVVKQWRCGLMFEWLESRSRGGD